MKASIVIDVIYEANRKGSIPKTKFDESKYVQSLVDSIVQFLQDDHIGDATGVVMSCAVRSETTKESPKALREPLQLFAEHMERNLRKYDDDRGDTGWRKETVEYLMQCVHGEEAEFNEALGKIKKCDLIQESMNDLGLGGDGGQEAVTDARKRFARAAISELADMANFAMMMADILRVKYLTLDKKEPTPASCDACDNHLKNAGTSYRCNYTGTEFMLPHYPVRPAKCPRLDKAWKEKP
jgi:hypothetical protein